jgi:hypothetical protein
MHRPPMHRPRHHRQPSRLLRFRRSTLHQHEVPALRIPT